MQDGRWTTKPCDWERVDALSRELGLSDTTATRSSVAASTIPPRARVSRREAAAPRPLSPRRHGRGGRADRPRGARGSRICVHGDYDVDGISATVVALLTLRELGAHVEWRLPSRFEEGYGLAPETIEQLAEDGVDLVLTVDCGITAVAEVARATRSGST